MITYAQALILGAIQGVTELFPISSLGHSVILPALFGWNIDQKADAFLVFLVATHLATSLVLLAYFIKDWLKILRGMGRSIVRRTVEQNDTYARLGWLIVVSSVPAGILGLLFEDQLKNLFASPLIVSIFLILNGLILFVFESFRNKHVNESTALDDSRIAQMTWGQSVKIGFSQALALLPGFSRTGSTLGTGLLMGLNHENAARYSFLLATPIILAASVLKLPELIIPGNTYPTGPILIGSVMAAIAALLSIKFLLKYFETKTLKPFATYCVIAGIAFTAILMIR